MIYICVNKSHSAFYYYSTVKQVVFSENYLIQFIPVVCLESMREQVYVLEFRSIGNAQHVAAIPSYYSFCLWFSAVFRFPCRTQHYVCAFSSGDTVAELVGNTNIYITVMYVRGRTTKILCEQIMTSLYQLLII